MRVLGLLDSVLVVIPDVGELHVFLLFDIIHAPLQLGFSLTLVILSIDSKVLDLLLIGVDLFDLFLKFSDLLLVSLDGMLNSRSVLLGTLCSGGESRLKLGFLLFLLSLKILLHLFHLGVVLREESSPLIG